MHPLIAFTCLIFTSLALFANTIPVVDPLTSTSGSILSTDKRDDPTIWVHPTDPSQSLVLGSDKRAQGGGLHVYNLKGEEVQFLEGGKLNNVDIIPRFFPDGDLVLASERNNRTVKFYKINAKGEFSSLTTDIKIKGEPYGICGGKENATGLSYAFVTTKEGPVEQWELSFQTPDAVTGKLARTLPRKSRCEGCVVDSKGRSVFIGEEDTSVLQYDMDPKTDNKHYLVDEVGPRLKADIEGLALYHDGTHEYLIVSSQGDSSFAVSNPQNKPGKRYIGSFKLADTTETDGIAVTATPLGPDFPYGLFVAHNHRLSNFRFVPWERIATPLGIGQSVASE